MKKETSPFTGLKLAGFCMQVSILLKSAVPLYEGLQVMAEDSDREEEKAILSDMADKVRIGFPFGQAVAESSAFPAYVLHMIQLGERTGTLDITLERLSSYYEKEYYGCGFRFIWRRSRKSCNEFGKLTGKNRKCNISC